VFRSYFLLPNQGGLSENMTPPPIPPILGVFTFRQIAHVVVGSSIKPNLFGREIIFEVFQPVHLRLGGYPPTLRTV